MLEQMNTVLPWGQGTTTGTATGTEARRTELATADVDLEVLSKTLLPKWNFGPDLRAIWQICRPDNEDLAPATTFSRHV